MRMVLRLILLSLSLVFFVSAGINSSFFRLPVLGTFILAIAVILMITRPRKKKSKKYEIYKSGLNIDNDDNQKASGM